MKSIQFPRSRVPKGNIRFIYLDAAGNTKMFQTTARSEADFFKRMIDSSFKTRANKDPHGKPSEENKPV